MSSHCLDEDNLLSLSLGEGDAAERVHLEACRACTARYRHLVHDLDLIGRALRQAPPPEPARRTIELRPVLRWAPLAIAAMLVLAVGVQALRPVNERIADRAEVQADSVLAGLDSMSAALFAEGDPAGAALAGTTEDSDYAEAALQGTWPCSQAEAIATGCQ